MKISFVFIVLIIGISVLFANFHLAYAETKKEPYVVPIEKALYKGAYVYTYNVCAGSKPLTGAIILVYSKSAATIEKINQIRIGLCDTIDTRIMAIDPNTIQAKLIKADNVAKATKILENKVKSFQTKISELENASIIEKNSKPTNQIKVLKSNLELTNNKLRALKAL